MSIFGKILKRIRRAVVPRRDYQSLYDGLTLLHDDPTCAVYLSDGDGTGDLIVSFTGVGHAMGAVDMQSPEFRKLSKAAATVFVIDKTRSWGNALDVDAIVSCVRSVAADRKVHLIGNSLGGFLAVLFSVPLRATSVISFAPQYSISPDRVPEEKRWKSYRDAIAEIRFPDLDTAFGPGISYLTVFGGDPLDEVHFRYFVDRGASTVLRVNDADHGVAAYLKEHGLLYPVIETWFSDGKIAVHLSQSNLNHSISGPSDGWNRP
jgi:pimeloyl-ACP methyl ester carboxylesterase